MVAQSLLFQFFPDPIYIFFSFPSRSLSDMELKTISDDGIGAVQSVFWVFQQKESEHNFVTSKKIFNMIKLEIQYDYTG